MDETIARTEIPSDHLAALLILRRCIGARKISETAFRRAVDEISEELDSRNHEINRLNQIIAGATEWTD